MLVRSPSVLSEIEDMGITSPSRSFMQQRRVALHCASRANETRADRLHSHEKEWTDEHSLRANITRLKALV
ncbi:MAG: hypothetical protein VB125_02155 [Burkholderia sp.]